MALTLAQLTNTIQTLPWNQGATATNTSSTVPSLSQTVSSPTTNSTFKAYDPNGGTQAFKDTWGNNYTYRMPDGSVRNPAQTWESTLASSAKNPGSSAASLTSIMKPYFDTQYSDWTNVLNRRNSNAIYNQLSKDPLYSNIANKGLNQGQAAETIAGKLAGYGITDLNQLGVTQNGKFYSKLTGKEIPREFGYTTWGDGMNKFYLQATPDGRVVPTSVWKETGMDTGGILGTLAAVGGGLAAPWAIPALSGALGVGSIAAGGLYGAGTGALSSGLSGDNILSGALTGGVTGAVGGGLMDYFSSNPVTTGSNAISNAGSTAADITTDILNSGTQTGTSSAFNLGQLVQDPSSILHVGDTDNMLPGTSLASGNSGITGLTGGGTGLTNAASTGGAVASDVLGAGGTSAITAAEGLGGLSSNLGGGLVATAGGVVPAATAATTAAGSSITDYVTDLFSGGVDKFMKDPISNSLKLGSGIISYLQSQGKAEDLQNLLNQGLSQSDPFGSQRAYYAGRLKDTYTNPLGVMNSPEYQAVRAKELDALERADAAQGRKSQYGARAEKMNQNFMDYLTKERAQLSTLAGAGISPSQVSSLLEKLGVGSSDAQINGTGQLIFALNQILSGK